VYIGLKTGWDFGKFTSTFGGGSQEIKEVAFFSTLSILISGEISSCASYLRFETE